MIAPRTRPKPTAKSTPPVPRPPKTADASTYQGRFALRLRALRVKKYGTQAEFVDGLKASGIEVSQKTVSSWEIGERCPQLAWFPAIANALGVKPGQLLPPE